MTYPSTCPVFRLRKAINDHWPRGTLFELTGVDEAVWAVPIWRLDGTYDGLLSMYRLFESEPLTSQARAMAAIIRRGIK